LRPLPGDVPQLLLLECDPAVAAEATDALRAAFGATLDVRLGRSLGDARSAVEGGPPVVIVSALTLADSDGMGTVDALHALAPAVSLVIWADALDDAMAIEALRRGALECASRAAVPAAALARTVRFAMQRQRHLAELEATWADVAHRAAHDPLTGLANRELFHDHLERTLSAGVRYGRKTGLLFIDLDDFKGINDVHGHAAGDRVLREVAARLVECMRRSDAVGRMGGDEFVVLVPEATSSRDVLLVRDLIQARLREPVALEGGQRLTVGASIGCAMAPLDGTSAQQLLDVADAAMYRMKSAAAGVGGPGAPTPARGVGAVGAVGGAPVTRREARLREAVRAHQLEVHYQPILDVEAGRVVAAEAFLRWRTPDRGLVGPSSFLTLAEDTGLIVPIGEFVLREACRTAVRWRSRHPGVPLRLSVNISPVQVRERDFDDRVAAILGETGCPPDALLFELSERTLAGDGEMAVETLRALKAIGIPLLVDDFGVGHASLAFLREAPVDALKVDRRFVAHMLTDPRDLAIVGALVRLAHGVGLGVLAEGVESAEQAKRLAELRCVEQQGRHFSDALPAEALLAYGVTHGLGAPVVAGDARSGQRAG
jgi:diguanylate cyclase (GGDEF)-like protein